MENVLIEFCNIYLFLKKDEIPKKNRANGKPREKWDIWLSVSLSLNLSWLFWRLKLLSAMFILTFWFYLNTTKCFSTPNICPFLFLTWSFIWGWGVTGVGFQGCLQVRTCMHLILLKSWRRSMLLEHIKA